MTALDLPGPSAPAAGVAVLSAGAAWEAALLPWLDRGGLVLVRRCVDVADLLAVCAAGSVRVAIVDAGAPRLDRDVVQRLRRLGVPALAVEPPAGAPRELDAADVVAATEAPATIVARALALVRRGSTVLPAPAPVPGDEAAPSPAGTSGRMVAVWGPAGAPGRTTIAVNLATELAQAGRSVLLVDADTSGGAVATVLGILDEAPGVASACRTALRGRLDAGVLAALAVTVQPGLRVLTGSPRPDRWRELRPAALDVLWPAARQLAEVVVVDVAAGLSGDDPDPLEPLLAGPSAVTSSALRSADVTVAVSGSDALGLLRLVHGLDLLREQMPEVRPVVVANRVRSSVLGTHPRQQVREAFARVTGSVPLALLPDDPRAVDAAVRAGRPLAEVAAGSPLRRAISDLAGVLLPVPAEAQSPGGTRRRGSRARSLPSRV